MDDTQVTVTPIESEGVADPCRFFILHGGGVGGADKCASRSTFLATLLFEDGCPAVVVPVCTVHGDRIAADPRGLVWANTITEPPYVYREVNDPR